MGRSSAQKHINRNTDERAKKICIRMDNPAKLEFFFKEIEKYFK